MQTATSEMAHLFFVTLGNKGFCDPAASTATTCVEQPAGWGLTNAGNFQNMQSQQCWLGLEYSRDRYFEWLFRSSEGFQG